MKLEIEAYITGCSVFLLIKPESEEAEFGKVMSSVLRWGAVNPSEVNLTNAPLSIRHVLGNVTEAYGGSLGLDNEEFEGMLLVGSGGNVVVNGRFKSCTGEVPIGIVNDLAGKLVNSLMSIYGTVTSLVHIYKFTGRLTMEASTLPP